MTWITAICDEISDIAATLVLISWIRTKFRGTLQRVYGIKYIIWCNRSFAYLLYFYEDTPIILESCMWYRRYLWLPPTGIYNRFDDIPK